MNPDSAAAVTPAQPYLARNRESAWARVSDIRDGIYGRFTLACRDRGIDALVHKSLDFEYPAWVLLQAWLPAAGSGATHRVRLLVFVEPTPGHEREFVYRIQCFREGREKTYGPLWDLADDKLAAWVDHLLGHGPRPPYRPWRLRAHPYELWYRRNKVRDLTVDPLKAGIYIGVAAGLAALAASLSIVGAACFLIAAAFGAFAWRRYPLYVNPGRPEAEPRSLRLVDSWQTVLAGLGGAWPEIRDRLHRRLRESDVPGIHSRLENVSYLTPDGKQEREQVALHLGRGIVFCHLYPYGEDLYVGWDAFMNYGSWSERTVAVGYHRALCQPVVLNDVRPESSPATEYDLIDLNCVTEWAHARIVSVLKQVIAERKIDQEIDFRITRGERQSLFKDEGHGNAPARPSRDRPWLAGGPERRFSRTA